MTEKSFIKWLRRFLDKTNIKELENLRHRHDPTYNHTTALREIFDKLEDIDLKKNDQEYSQDNWDNSVKSLGKNPNSFL
jgi:hypothetical protein